MVCLHTSYKSFGGAENGPNTIIDGFLSSSCTLICPTFFYHSETYPPDGNYLNNGIDYARETFPAPSSFEGRPDQIDRSMGIIPQTMLTYPGSKRTQHPLNSFVVLGKEADKLVEDQCILNVYSIYKTLYRNQTKAYVVLAGVGLTSCTPIHFAEEMSGRVLFRRWAIHNGMTVEAEVGSCSNGFENLADSTAGIEFGGVLGRSVIRAFNFHRFIDVVTQAIGNTPSITSCSDGDCPRCKDMQLGGRGEALQGLGRL